MLAFRPTATLALPLLLLADLATPQEARATQACPAPSGAEVIGAVSSSGEVALASGGQARLSGVRLPEDASFRDQALSLLRQYQGAEAKVFAQAPDRWERLPARVTVGGSDLAEKLVESGLGIVDARAAGSCAPALLKVEAAARAARRGLWADERHLPVLAQDGARLRQRIGRFALIEGRIASVGERPQRIYLNFGRDWTEDFTITIPKRTWTSMAERGISAQTLRGRHIRARGVIEEWNGTALTIQEPEMLELLD